MRTNAHDRRFVATRRSEDSVVEWARWWQETGEYELRQILHWKWDPIGVASAFPWAADEYDRYAPQIAAALKERASAAEIAELLGCIECDRMGLREVVPEFRREVPEFRQKVAVHILAWYESSQTRWLEFGPLTR